MQQSSPSMSTVLLRRRPWVIFVDVDLFCHLSIYLLVSVCICWYLLVSIGIYGLALLSSDVHILK
jgi:hypothetical protein